MRPLGGKTMPKGGGGGGEFPGLGAVKGRMLWPGGGGGKKQGGVLDPGFWDAKIQAGGKKNSGGKKTKRTYVKKTKGGHTAQKKHSGGGGSQQIWGKTLPGTQGGGKRKKKDV